MSWRNDVAPFMIEVMDTFHPSGSSEITVVQKPVQVAASEAMNTLKGWVPINKRSRYSVFNQSLK